MARGRQRVVKWVRGGLLGSLALAQESALWTIVAEWRAHHLDWTPALHTDDNSECDDCGTSEFWDAMSALEDLPHDLHHDLIERIERHVGIDDRVWWRSNESDARTDALVFEMQCALRLLGPAIGTMVAEWLDPIVSDEIDELVAEIEQSLALHASDDADSGERD